MYETIGSILAPISLLLIANNKWPVLAWTGATQASILLAIACYQNGMEKAAMMNLVFLCINFCGLINSMRGKNGRAIHN